MPESPLRTLLRKLRARLWWWLRRDPVFYARLRERFSRRPLSPGDLVRLDLLERANQQLLLERAQELGPVFKGIAWGHLCVCVVGLDDCRRFLQQHRSSVRAMKMHLGEFIPGGFVCAREGEAHRVLRRPLQQAVQDTATTVAAPGLDAEVEAIGRDALQAYAASAATHGHAPSAYRDTLLTIVTSTLVRISYGVAPGRAAHQRLSALHGQFSSVDLQWEPGSHEARTFHAIRSELLGLPELTRQSGEEQPVTGLLERCRAHGSLDEAMLGTLIYQLEGSRHDMKNFLGWLTLHAGSHPRVIERIREERQGAGEADRAARAMVAETLRHNQSERLMRQTLKDLVFDGYLIPCDSIVRLCLWESHREPAHFTDPLIFDPERFLMEPPRRESFAPFGLDHHQCPMDAMVVRIGIAFLRALADFHIDLIHPGPPRRGRFHWETPVDFSVRLEPRESLP